MSEKVKAKVIAMLYSWTVSLPDEAKISEAYQMLKTQGKKDADHLQTTRNILGEYNKILSQYKCMSVMYGKASNDFLGLSRTLPLSE